MTIFYNSQILIYSIYPSHDPVYHLSMSAFQHLSLMPSFYNMYRNLSACLLFFPGNTNPSSSTMVPSSCLSFSA